MFLRGINVNGISIKMDSLKEAFIRMGLEDVKTILATGNVVFTYHEKTSRGQEFKSFVENELSRRFLYDAHVVIRGIREIHGIVSAAQTMAVQAECHNYHLLFDDAELSLELKQLFDSMPHTPLEQLLVLECGVFWIVPKGETLRSDFGSKVLGNHQYKSRLTSRNMNTIHKIYKTMLD